MKIAFFECDKQEQEYLEENLDIKGKFRFFEKEINNRNVKEVLDYDGLVVFISSEVNEDLLNKFNNLKFIATMSTGYDHIDLNVCKRRGIKVSNVPSYGENTVAEHVFGLILSLSKKIPESIERTKDDDFSLKGLEGFDLKGKTIGVVGVGNIGENVVKIAKGFEMNVIAFKRHKDLKLAKKLGFSYVSLSQLLSKSDIVTFHVPLTKETKHMINLNNIKKMKKGSYLINTSRGDLIDNTALIYALDNKILAGAGLDVLEGECDIKEERELLKENFEENCDIRVLLENHKLLKEKNVIVTPHSAFYTKEAIQRIMDVTISNVKDFVNGKVRNGIL